MHTTVSDFLQTITVPYDHDYRNTATVAISFSLSFKRSEKNNTNETQGLCQLNNFKFIQFTSDSQVWTDEVKDLP